MTKPLSPDEVNDILGLEFDFESWLDAWMIARLTENRARAHAYDLEHHLMTGNGVQNTDKSWE